MTGLYVLAILSIGAAIIALAIMAIEEGESPEYIGFWGA